MNEQLTTNTDTRRSSRGFTLVEMIIYIAFFSVLSILAVNTTIIMMKSFYNLRMTQNVSQSATTALENISRQIRNAYDIDTGNSTLGTSPGRLTLLTEDEYGTSTTVEFYVDAASQLNMIVGGVNKGQLVTKSVTVTNLVFRQITTTNSKAVKVELSLRDSRQGVTKTVSFYDTIILRGSIH